MHRPATILATTLAAAALAAASHPEVRRRTDLAAHVLRGRPLIYRATTRHGSFHAQRYTKFAEVLIDGSLPPEHEDALQAIRDALVVLATPPAGIVAQAEADR